MRSRSSHKMSMVVVVSSSITSEPVFDKSLVSSGKGGGYNSIDMGLSLQSHIHQIEEKPLTTPC